MVRHGQKAGDIVEHPVGVAEEDVDDLGDEPLVLWRLQLLVVLVQIPWIHQAKSEDSHTAIRGTNSSPRATRSRATELRGGTTHRGVHVADVLVELAS